MSAAPAPFSHEFERKKSEFDASLEPHGWEILDDVREFIRRFCVFPDDHALNAVTLWAVHTHMIQHFHTTPRLLLSSPEPGSGKTRVLEVLNLLVPYPMFSLSASPAAVFRTLKDQQITLLFDEVDAIWSRKGKDDNHEDLRALLNAGYKCGATIPRCVGPKHEVQHFPVYTAVALAGIGDLPDTIMSRAIIVRMRRRGPADRVSPFRSRMHDCEGHQLRDELSCWAAKVGEKVGEAWPVLPENIIDRPAEIWEPLIAVADAAGGSWPTVARDACVALCEVAQDRDASLGIRLLRDLRTIFAAADRMHTKAILEKLISGEQAGLDADSPWADLRAGSIDERRLATMLKPYGVKSQKFRLQQDNLRGYLRADLHDAWERYLPSVPATVEPPEPPEPDADIKLIRGSAGSACSAPAGYEESFSGSLDAVAVGGDTDAPA